jgi:uncharacterized protein (DUF952 family)
VEERVFRVVRDAEWIGVLERGVLTPSALDKRDGYFHLSTQAATLLTANLYFSGETNLRVLEWETASLGDALRWEPVASRGGILFPHYYGRDISLEAVCSVHSLGSATDGFSWGSRLLWPPIGSE